MNAITIPTFSQGLVSGELTRPLTPSVVQATEDFFECACCGVNHIQLFQYDLCRICLTRRFNKLIPVLNKVRGR